MAKKMQEEGEGREEGGMVVKNCWMQFISPWRRGERASLFVAVVMGDRVSRERMEAPKSFEPEETPVVVRGIMVDSVRVRRVVRRVEGGCGFGGVLVLVGMVVVMMLLCGWMLWCWVMM